MKPTPVRVQPGEDLRRFLGRFVFEGGAQSGFVIAGLGSLQDARLRLAGHPEESLVAGPSELLSLTGSISADGCHVHVALSTDQGQVIGGHLGYGSMVRTTAELLLVPTEDHRLKRKHDPRTGYSELLVQIRASDARGAA